MFAVENEEGKGEKYGSKTPKDWIKKCMQWMYGWMDGWKYKNEKCM